MNRKKSNREISFSFSILNDFQPFCSNREMEFIISVSKGSGAPFGWIYEAFENKFLKIVEFERVNCRAASFGFKVGDIVTKIYDKVHEEYLILLDNDFSRRFSESKRLIISVQRNIAIEAIERELSIQEKRIIHSIAKLAATLKSNNQFNANHAFQPEISARWLSLQRLYDYHTFENTILDQKLEERKEVEYNILISKSHETPFRWTYKNLENGLLKILDIDTLPESFPHCKGIKCDDIITKIFDEENQTSLNTLDENFDQRCTELTNMRVYFRRLFNFDWIERVINWNVKQADHYILNLIYNNVPDKYKLKPLHRKRWLKKVKDKHRQRFVYLAKRRKLLTKSWKLKRKVPLRNKKESKWSKKKITEPFQFLVSHFKLGERQAKNCSGFKTGCNFAASHLQYKDIRRFVVANEILRKIKINNDNNRWLQKLIAKGYANSWKKINTFRRRPIIYAGLAAYRKKIDEEQKSRETKEVQYDIPIIKSKGKPLGVWELEKINGNELKIVSLACKCSASRNGLQRGDIIMKIYDEIFKQDLILYHDDFDLFCSELTKLRVCIRRTVPVGWEERELSCEVPMTKKKCFHEASKRNYYVAKERRVLTVIDKEEKTFRKRGKFTRHYFRKERHPESLAQQRKRIENYLEYEIKIKSLFENKRKMFDLDGENEILKHKGSDEDIVSSLLLADNYLEPGTNAAKQLSDKFLRDLHIDAIVEKIANPDMWLEAMIKKVPDRWFDKIETLSQIEEPSNVSTSGKSLCSGSDILVDEDNLSDPPVGQLLFSCPNNDRSTSSTFNLIPLVNNIDIQQTLAQQNLSKTLKYDLLKRKHSNLTEKHQAIEAKLKNIELNHVQINIELEANSTKKANCEAQIVNIRLKNNELIRLLGNGSSQNLPKSSSMLQLLKEKHEILKLKRSELEAKTKRIELKNRLNVAKMEKYQSEKIKYEESMEKIHSKLSNSTVKLNNNGFSLEPQLLTISGLEWIMRKKYSVLLHKRLKIKAKLKRVDLKIRLNQTKSDYNFVKKMKCEEKCKNVDLEILKLNR